MDPEPSKTTRKLGYKCVENRDFIFAICMKNRYCYNDIVAIFSLARKYMTDGVGFELFIISAVLQE